MMFRLMSSTFIMAVHLIFELPESAGLLYMCTYNIELAPILYSTDSLSSAPASIWVDIDCIIT